MNWVYLLHAYYHCTSDVMSSHINRAIRRACVLYDVIPSIHSIMLSLELFFALVWLHTNYCNFINYSIRFLTLKNGNQQSIFLWRSISIFLLSITSNHLRGILWTQSVDLMQICMSNWNMAAILHPLFGKTAFSTSSMIIVPMNSPHCLIISPDEYSHHYIRTVH